MKVEIRDASLEPDNEEFRQCLAVVAFGVEVGEVYGRDRAGAALQMWDGEGHLSRRDRVGLLAGHCFQEGEVEDNRGIAPRVILSYEPPLIVVQDGIFLWNDVINTILINQDVRYVEGKDTASTYVDPVEYAVAI